VGATNVGLYLKNLIHWHEKVKTIAGLRADFIHDDVTMLDTATHDPLVNSANSGDKDRTMLSPKFSLVLGPWFNTEYFLNAGYGYHSNDARGTVANIDPNDGVSSVGSVAPAAWSRGAEAGIRSNFIRGLNSTVAFWWLESSQELVFVGDAGTTEVNDKSYRYGVEWTNYYKPTDWLTLDADLALTSAQFAKTPDGETNSYVPNSVGRVFTTGATVVAPNGLFGTVRMRHFGEVPLDSSANFWAGDTFLVNLGAGYKHKAFKFELDVFNILGTKQSDIAYAYDYGFPSGNNQLGILKHPVEPRMFRGTITINF
jgi:hypothetical protein